MTDKNAQAPEHTGWLHQAHVRHCPSPNWNARPEQTPISLLVIHNISLPPRQFGGGYIHDLFTNTLSPKVHPYFETIHTLEVSSHFLIARTGEVTQFVGWDKRAWHAGASCFEGRENCNDFSIGIELEGADGMPYTQRQYEVLVSVIRQLRDEIPTLHDITGHEHIAPGRKTDPSASFDWRYMQTVLGDQFTFVL